MKAKSILRNVSLSVAGLALAAVSTAASANCIGTAECIPVPEPSILGLMGAGVVALAVAEILRRKRK